MKKNTKDKKTLDIFFKNLTLPLGLVCNDAGSANLIVNWFKEYQQNKKILCHVNGPAKEIFQCECPEIKNLPLDTLINSVRTLITGTGWSSNIEYNARLKASKNNVLNIAVLDHWTDYKKRFTRNSLEHLPEIILVSDEIALEKAKKIFPNIEILLLENLYLENLVLSIKKGKLHNQNKSHKILYVLEPIRGDWGDLKTLGEFQALDYFVENLNLFGSINEIEIRLRKHPSESNNKYLSWLKKNKEINVSMDISSSLVDSIKWSDTVVGCQTFAMVIGLKSGRRVVTSIPPNMPKCVLAQKEIKTIEQLKNYC